MKQFRYTPVGLDAFDPFPGQPPAGTIVRKVKPYPGCPPNGTMGFCYVAPVDAPIKTVAGGRVLPPDGVLVLLNSLVLLEGSSS